MLESIPAAPDWQMPGPPPSVQNLHMPHPRDWKGGQMPRSSPGGGGGGGWLGAAGIDWCITTGFPRKIVSLRYRTAERRERQNACVRQTWQPHFLCVWWWSSLKLLFSGLLHEEVTLVTQGLPSSFHWETCAEIPYWWRVTTRIWVVPLTGHGKSALTIQKHYPDLGSGTYSVRTFCAHFSVVISRENWWHRQIPAVFVISKMIRLEEWWKKRFFQISMKIL